jgi:hypothetical protein
LLGRISAIRPDEQRWPIAISEFVRISRPNLWGRRRNPVRYTTLAELEIDLDDLEWQRVPEGLASNSQTASEARPEPLLTIAEAKKRLAVTFA